MPYTFKVGFSSYYEGDETPKEIKGRAPNNHATVVARDALEAAQKLVKSEVGSRIDQDIYDDDGCETGETELVKCVRCLIHSVEVVSDRIDIR